MQADRAAAQDQRLWGKRAPLYEQLPAQLQAIREHSPGSADFDPDTVVQVLENLQSRVAAYASGKVWEAYSNLDLMWRMANTVPREEAESLASKEALGKSAGQLFLAIRSELQPTIIGDGIWRPG